MGFWNGMEGTLEWDAWIGLWIRMATQDFGMGWFGFGNGKDLWNWMNRTFGVRWIGPLEWDGIDIGWNGQNLWNKMDRTFGMGWIIGMGWIGRWNGMDRTLEKDGQGFGLRWIGPLE